MGIRYDDGTAVLEDHVNAEDAEALQQWLREQAQPQVHLGACADVHAATLQVLLALRPRLLAPPAERWLAQALVDLPA